MPATQGAWLLGMFGEETGTLSPTLSTRQIVDRFCCRWNVAKLPQSPNVYLRTAGSED